MILLIFLLIVALALETLGPLPFSKNDFRFELPLKDPRSFLYSSRILGQFGALTHCCVFDLKELKDQVPFY